MLPAVQQAREAARRLQCSNNLKQLGLALHNHHDTFLKMPKGNTFVVSPDSGSSWCMSTTGNENEQGAPWTVSILPFIEQNNLHDSFDLNQPFGNSGGELPAPNNNFIQPLEAFRCPSDPITHDLPYNNYFGVMGGGSSSQQSCAGSSGTRPFYTNGLLYANSETNFRDVVDGTSHVFLVGESLGTPFSVDLPNLFWWTWAGKAGSAAYPGNVAAASDQVNSPLAFPDVFKSFGSHHPGGCQMLNCDGSVRFLQETVDLDAYRSQGIRNDGLPIGEG
ncbi:DUF1559 domain-containing protein [Blastopirellula sp. J2-11]|nr:DUF1559 domain-containing protein [Blastopirellula sp. J2-11]